MRKFISIVLSLCFMLSVFSIGASAANNTRLYVPSEIKDTAHGGNYRITYNTQNKSLDIVRYGKVGKVGIQASDYVYLLPFAVQTNAIRQNISLLDNRFDDVVFVQSTAVRTGKVKGMNIKNAALSTRKFTRNSKGRVTRCKSSDTDSAYSYNPYGYISTIVLDDSELYVGGDCSKYYYTYKDGRLKSYKWELFQYWGKSTLALNNQGRVVSNSYKTKNGGRNTIRYTYNKSGKPVQISYVCSNSKGKTTASGTTKITYNSHGYMTAISYENSKRQNSRFQISWQAI